MPYKDPIKRKQYHKEYSKKWAKRNPDKLKLYKERHRKKYLIKIRKKDREAKWKWLNCQICGIEMFGHQQRKFCNKCRSTYLSNKYKGNQYWKCVKNRLKGKNHHWWRGGVTHWRRRIWDSSKYRQWRLAVFRRDDYTCQNCNARGKYLEAHHLKQFVFLLIKYNITSKEEADKCDDLWDIALGQTLCRKCHNITKNGKPKIQRTP